MKNISVLRRVWPEGYARNISTQGRNAGLTRLLNLTFIMKLSVIAMVIIAVSAQMLMAEPGRGQTSRSPGSVSDDKKITIGCRNESLRNVLKQVEQLSGYRIAFPSEEVSRYTGISLSREARSVKQTLELILKATIFDFTYNGNTIVVFERDMNDSGMTAPRVQQPAIDLSPSATIKGRVVEDKGGEPLRDVSVMVKGASIGVYTNKDGEFSIAFSGAGRVVLVITHIGYMDKELIARTDGYNTIRLVVSDQSLATVEISTGMFKRNKESFTGATSTFSGDQLRTVGNRNIIQSLKTLDPSFVVVENNQLGSDPNALPAIELRGKTSVSTTATTTKDLNSQYAADPNLPLFVLNGFPTTLQMINDLDMSRVASVTILKDAASTAIWGAQAANGVVVVETKRPVAGELRASFTEDVRVNLPDLSSYNMMNAREKLEFEKLSGIYTLDYAQYAADKLYNQRLADITSGVNTYWLSEPVRTGTSTRHSLTLTGGNNELLFGAGAFYNNDQGAMKGSSRKSWGANVDLTYRKGHLNINDLVQISGVTSNESNYGSFSNFVKANPYLMKRSADGSIPKYSDSSFVEYFSLADWTYNATLEGKPYGVTVVNPLYNASLNSFNQSKNFAVSNNLQAIWSFTPDLMLSGELQLSRSTVNQVIFVDPQNTGFDALPYTQKGSYNSNTIEEKGYASNIMLAYARVFNNTHSLNINIRGSISETSSQGVGFAAVGYPVGTDGNPSYANQYEPYSVPDALIQLQRTTSALSSVNYSYKMRYLVDLSYNLNGTNAYGTSSKTQKYWSVGIGWNLKKESFMQGTGWIDMLKLRANIGLSGNESLGTFSSSSIYQALAGSNPFGQSLDMTFLGNPALQRQNTKNISAGVDLTLLRNRVSATLNYNDKTTDPLIVTSSSILPASSGFQFPYPVNVGSLTYKGWELMLRVSPVYRLKERIVWTLGLSGIRLNGKYGGLGNALDAANKAELEAGTLSHYADGYSPDDIWAVRSKGIDPATGMEIFQKVDGTQTFKYSSDDIVRVGNSRPDLQGVISSNFSYKGFYLNLNFSYQLNGYLFNKVLYNKVENIGYEELKYNQDKRALYQRWQKPGDVAQFKAIQITEYSPISSRFVQKSSYLSGEALQVGWDFSSSSWIHRLHMQTLRASFTTNDIFRLTTVKAERGIDYPFVRMLAFTLNASF